MPEEIGNREVEGEESDVARREIASIAAGMSDAAKLLLKKTLEIEEAKLHMKKPRGVVQEIADEVRRLVK